MAHALTAVRLALVLPLAVGLRPARAARAGRRRPPALPGNRHRRSRRTRRADERERPRPGASCSITARTVSSSPAGLAGAAMTGAVTPLLPVLVPIAFGQYVVDSYVWHRQRQLRASFLGRWNGILYFVPLVLIAASRLHLPGGRVPALGRRSAGVRAGGVNRGVRDRSRDDSGQTATDVRARASRLRNRIECRAARAAGRASGCSRGSSGCPGSPASAGRRTYCRCSGD